MKAKKAAKTKSSQPKSSQSKSKKVTAKKKSSAKKAKPAKVKAAARKSATKKSGARKSPVKKILAKKASKSKPATKAPAKNASARKVLQKKTASPRIVKKPVKKAAARKAPAPRKASVKKSPARHALLQSIAASHIGVYQGQSAELMNVILAALDDAKAENTVTINLQGRSTMADGMVVTTGRVNRHVAAIAEQLVTKLKAHGKKDIRVEGLETGDWCLVDSGDIIIHIFRPEVRTFYNLEKLWSTDAPLERT